MIRVELSVVDPFAVAAFAYMGWAESTWWWILVPIVVAGWFINPRRDNTGWRFLR